MARFAALSNRTRFRLPARSRPLNQVSLMNKPRFLSFFALASLLVASVASAQNVDLSYWRKVPVFESKGMSGRVEPLDSFARQAMDDICNQVKGEIKLNLTDFADEGADLTKTDMAPALALFPEGKTRKFAPAELLLSWLSEPEKWETVPFIFAAHKDVRELVGVPERNDRGLHLKYVSPKQIFESDKLRTYLRELHEREGTPGFKANETEKRVIELMNRYHRYRAITLDASQPLTAGIVSPPGGRREFLSQLDKIINLVQTPNANGKTLLSTLQLLAGLPEDGKESGGPSLPQSAQRTYAALGEVIEVGGKLYGQWSADVKGQLEAGDYDDSLQLQEAADAVVHLRVAVSDLEAALKRHRDRLFDRTSTVSAAQKATLAPLFREMADKASDLRVRAMELDVALYEDGNTIRVVPALNPAALSKARDTTVKSQPWYSLQAVLLNGPLMADYPSRPVDAVRESWEALKKAYTNREAPDRAERLVAAQIDFYQALEELGEATEPLREKLVETELEPAERDAAILAYTQWPDDAGRKRIDAELLYNRIDPFKWTWIISLASLACFALSFGVLKRPMYIAAIAFLCLTILWSGYGFYLRVYVTQWAPVTNMYETVVWVAFCTALLGAWFLLLPMIWQGLKDAWRATAFPFTFEAAELDEWQQKKLSPPAWMGVNLLMSALRLVLMGVVFYALAIDTSYSDGQRAIFSLLPNLADVGTSSGQVVQQVIVWLVSFLCLLLSVWYVPRLTLTFLASIVTIPWDLFLRRGQELKKLGSEVRTRWPIGVGAVVVSAGGAWLAWMAPSVLDESFSPLQPVLRSNFWLTVHVLTIVSSYAAGFLAFGIGLIALAYYLFGTYRDPVVAQASGGFRPAGQDDGELYLARRPPEEVATLTQYAYRAVQVAVLLLAAGTILGGIWADRSWGRFWGWDPKEVWALVSLLVYLAILHGRYAGWFNNFGMIFGTVLGATAILMSWYGVNFVLPMLAPDGSVGLHSYGSGAGGFTQVLSFVIIVWIYQGAATIRYWSETSTAVQPVKVEAPPVPNRVRT